MHKSDLTEDWQLYENCKNYLGSQDPNYFDMVNTNIDFVNGDQWRNLVSVEKLPKPVFNILDRILQYFVAFLLSMAKKIVITKSDIYEDDNMPDDQITPIDVANAEIKNILNEQNFKMLRQDALTAAGTTGDGYVHFLFDKKAKAFGGAYSNIKGKIKYEFVSSTNVFFVNANNGDKEIQPRIIVIGRDNIKNLQKEYDELNKGKDTIVEDDDTDTVAGNKLEVELDGNGKALYAYIYRRDDDGTIYASKCVKNAYIFKDEPTDLEHYPIAKLPWKKQPNQYWGRALVTGMIPNQIYINQMFAMIMYHERRRAFPTIVFNKDKLPDGFNPSLGATIGITGVDESINIKNLVDTITIDDISNQLTNTIELTMQYTKECLGISDASLGNIDPKNTSAIVAVQKSSTVPLGNISTNEDVFLKDTTHILLDFMGAYYGTRPICVEKSITNTETGKTENVKQVVDFDFAQIKDIDLNVNVEVSESSYFSEPKQKETLDNMYLNGMLTKKQYVERLGNEDIKDRQKLLDDFEQEIQAQAQQQVADTQAQYEQMAQFFNTLPPEEQARLKSLPDAQMEEEVLQMMRATQ